MRAVLVTRFGGPEVMVLGEVPDPVPGPGQAVVDVAVSGVTFVETQMRAGTDRWHERPALPYVPGGMVAGRVSAAGDGTDPGWVGRRVLAGTGNTGGFAERAVVDAIELIPVPDRLDLSDAVALHTDGSTATGLVEGAQIKAGDWVLVEAAAGGVGSLLVQLAVTAGAHVVAAARGERKLDATRALGAEIAVDYSQPGWAEQVREATGGSGPDVVFDGVGGAIGRAAFEVTARGGRFSVHGASSGEPTIIDPQEAHTRGVQVLPIEQLFTFGPKMRGWAEQIMAETAAGRVRPMIGQTFPLEQAAAAHAAIESRQALGKTLITVA